ncbi:MAG: hypothetical protein ABEK59_05440, partial [Halobacteria archaeon]
RYQDRAMINLQTKLSKQPYDELIKTRIRRRIGTAKGIYGERIKSFNGMFEVYGAYGSDLPSFLSHPKDGDLFQKMKKAVEQALVEEQAFIKVKSVQVSDDPNDYQTVQVAVVYTIRQTGQDDTLTVTL